MTTQPTYQGIVHGLSNEDYRAAKGDNASFFKVIVDRSVKHAMTPRKKTKALNTGLNVHEFILEHKQFLVKFKQGPNAESYPNMIQSSEEMRSVIKKINESRLPKLKTSGTKPELLASIANDDVLHLQNVQDTAKLATGDLKDKIKMINSQPNRGLLATNGTTQEMAQRCRDVGANVFCFADLEDSYKPSSDAVELLPHDDWTKYESMYQSLIGTLTEGAQKGDTVMGWLLHGFTVDGAMQNEVSVFTETDKCRYDSLIDTGAGSFPVDLKSTADASLEQFGKSAARYHYDLQAAHYTDVGIEAGIDLLPFVFVAIESEAPYGVTVQIADEACMDSGRLKRAYAKKQLTAFKESGTVCAYEPVATAVVLPSWNNYGPWVDG